jgi:signal transduction histidine kinase
MYRLFEVDPADFSGHYRAWESLLSPEAKKRATEELQDALDGKKPFDTTFEIVTRKGIRKHIGGRGVVIRNEFGEPIEMLGINWDRTREVELEGLLDLEKAKSLHTAKLASLGEMSAGIAHEINNPLAIISGNLPLLEKARGDQAQFESKIATLSRSIARIEKIVKGLRKFSRTSDPFTKSTENLDKIIQEALTITGAKSRRHSTPVETYFDGALHIDCDPVEIEQVFGNLISNAIDAVKTSDERWVKIYAQSDDTHVTVRCMDSGKGIPAEIAQKLFQPFFTTKPVGEGTGLGLSISKGILDHHQASLTLVQDSPHTCFEIRFSKSRSVPSEIKETAQVGLKPETHADLIQVHRSILT